MRVIKGKYSGLWAVRDVLYYSCPICGRHMPWQKYVGSTVLVSSCCSFLYNAKPLNEASRFEVFVTETDVSNVIALSFVDYGPDSA